MRMAQNWKDVPHRVQMAFDDGEDRPAGRPSSLTPETAAVILDAVKGGASQKDAAAMAGIPQSTMSAWKRKGADQIDGPYREFALEMKRALVEWKMKRLESIRQAAEEGRVRLRVERTKYKDGSQKVVETREEGAPSWQASAWLLERMFPDEFGRKGMQLNLAAGAQSGGGDGAAVKVQMVFDDGDTEAGGPLEQMNEEEEKEFLEKGFKLGPGDEEEAEAEY